MYLTVNRRGFDCSMCRGVYIFSSWNEEAVSFPNAGQQYIPFVNSDHHPEEEEEEEEELS